MVHRRGRRKLASGDSSTLKNDPPYPSASGDVLRTLEVVEVCQESDFLALEQDWNVVARGSRPASVFLRHEWFAAAWAWRKTSAQLHILVARQGAHVVGVLPLIRRSDTSPRLVEYQMLTIPDSQVCDVLCAPADAVEVTGAFAAKLGDDPRWDKLSLDFLPPNGPGIGLLVPALRRRDLGVAERDCGRNFFISLSGTWNEYYGTRSRRLRKAMNLASNRLHKVGDIEIERIGASNCDPSRLHAVLDAAIDISARSWKRSTGNSLEQPGPQAFIRCLSQLALEQDWLAIWLLRVGGQTLAMEYDLLFEDSVHALRADFDAACVRTSPGTHLFRHLLEHFFASDFKRYYMGRGQNAYKMRWSDQGESLRQVVAYNRTPNGRIGWLRDEVVKPALRWTRDTLLTNEKAALLSPSK